MNGDEPNGVTETVAQEPKKSIFMRILTALPSLLKKIDSETRRDAIALVGLLVCGTLMIMGKNSVVTAAFLAITGYYFGRRNINKVESN